MSDEELLARGARRVVAKAEDAPLMQPCRVSLRDSEPGEVSILLHHPHHVAPTSPYRASGPIFVREGVAETASFVNHVPEQQLKRLLSVRAYDAAGIMVDAEVGQKGTELEALIERMFRRDDCRLPARAQRKARVLFVPHRSRVTRVMAPLPVLGRGRLLPGYRVPTPSGQWYHPAS